MWPILLQLGPVQIQTASLFFVIAFIIMSFVFWRRGKEEHYAEDTLFDGFLFSLVWSVFWSRVGFILFHLEVFGLSPLKWFDVLGFPGLTPLFGVLSAGFFLYRYAKRQKWNPFEVLDFGALSITAGLVVVWLGAFFDGSGIGSPTQLPWGVTFPAVFDKRHPTQLYAALLYLLLFWFLSWAEGHYRTFNWYRDKKHSAQTGFLWCSFLIAYGGFGIILSLLSLPSMVVMGVALDIPIRVAILLFGVGLLYSRTGRSFLPGRRAKLPYLGS